MSTLDPIPPKRFSGLHKVWSTPHAHPSARVREEVRDKSIADLIREDAEIQREYIERFQRGEPWMDRLLFRAHYGMLNRMVMRYGRSLISEYSYWMQTALLGLLEGCARYDLTRRDISPVSYLWSYVKGYLCREIANVGQAVRVPINQLRVKGGPYRLGRAHVLPFSDMSDGTPDELTDWEDLLTDEAPLPDEFLSEGEVESKITLLASYALSKIRSERARDVLIRRFYKDEALAAIGEVMGVSRERIRQIESEALGEVRTALVRLGSSPGAFSSYEEWMLAALASLQKVLDDEPEERPRINVETFDNVERFARAISEHHKSHGRMRIVVQTASAIKRLRSTLKRVTGVRPRHFYESDTYKIVLACPACLRRFKYEEKRPRAREPFLPYLRLEDIADRLKLPSKSVQKALKVEKIKPQATYWHEGAKHPLWHKDQVAEFQQLVRPV